MRAIEYKDGRMGVSSRGVFKEEAYNVYSAFAILECSECVNTYGAEEKRGMKRSTNT